MDLAGRLAAGIRDAVAGVPEAADFLADWPDGAGPRRAQVAGTLPVCRWLEGMAASVAGDVAANQAGSQAGSVVGSVLDGLVGLVAREAAALEWRQTYGAGDFGADFLSRYGWTEVVGLRGPIPSARVAAGFLMLGPQVTYPPHAHEAAEIYLPLSGLAWWQKGAAAFAPVAVGQAIHHAPWVPHAMRTGAEPMLALYLWRGGDLAAKSVILG